MADEPGTGTGMNKKILGMPMWLAITGGAALVAGVYFWYRNKKSATAASSTTSTNGTSTSDSGNAGLDTEEYESLLAQLRDIQGEEASEPNPAPGPPGPPGPPGKPGPPVLQGGNPPGSGKPPVKAPPPAPAPHPTQKKTVKVAPYPAWNSTLWGIAGKEYGKSDTQNVDKIYTANEPLIVGEEIRHGMSRTQAQQRKWLYPGEVLSIP